MIVDFGCGIGNFILKFVECWLEVIVLGIDLLFDMFDKVCVVSDGVVNVCFEEGDIVDFVVLDGECFELVFINVVLYWLLDYEMLFLNLLF